MLIIVVALVTALHVSARMESATSAAQTQASGVPIRLVPEDLRDTAWLENPSTSGRWGAPSYFISAIAGSGTLFFIGFTVRR
jgi:hypothetical protein